MVANTHRIVLPPLASVPSKPIPLEVPVKHSLPSRPPPLPSLRSICPDLDVAPLPPTSSSRNHFRTVSVPSMLPSRQSQRLSMDDLLSAIDLDQKMRAYYTTERAKGVRRDLQRAHHAQHFKARRRSKSAPAAPPTYYRYASSLEAELTQSIVQRHLEFSKRH